MVSHTRKTIWSPFAKKSLKSIYTYIKKRESERQANIVKSEILSLAGSLGNFPEKFQRDPFLDDNFINIRYALIWSYKVIYEVDEQHVIILDIFHTSRNPKLEGRKK